MKKRILWRVIITFFSVFLYGFLQGLWNAFESPIRGVTNAQLMTDSPLSWGWFKFVSGGGIPELLSILFLSWILILWGSILFKNKKTNEK